MQRYSMFYILSWLDIVVPTMILVPAVVDRDVESKLVYFIHWHCWTLLPYHDTGSRSIRWECEEQDKCKDIVYCTHFHGWSLWSLP